MTAARSTLGSLLRTPRRVGRTAAFVAVALVTALSAQPASTVEAGEVASIHEARLRKLHLVRPDLINFPISFDAVC